MARSVFQANGFDILLREIEMLNQMRVISNSGGCRILLFTAH